MGRKSHFDVAIIGGGITGASIFRDMAIRGLKVVLIERSKILTGTSIRSHQNLVGGMRYVVSDPTVAKDCASENRILSRIAPNLVGESKCYFLGFHSDYTEQAVKSAKKLGVVAEELDMKEVIEEIPTVNSDIDVAYMTDDRAIDVNRFCLLSCLSAKEHNGVLLDGTEIKGIEIYDDPYSTPYTIKTTDRTIVADWIINATGPWVNTIVQFISDPIPLSFVQGTIIIQRTLANRSIQCLRPPSDGDAYIVHGDEAWLGTTSTPIPGPDCAMVEYWADEYLREQFADIIPLINRRKTLHSFAGVRAFPKADSLKKTDPKLREASRDYHIIESAPCFISVISGKLTTARFMAEKITDSICGWLGVSDPCQTAKIPLDG
jgi:glycerol-3-phosphate dehydrogenase